MSYVAVSPSQLVKHPKEREVAGCYLRNSGGVWILLRDDRTARMGDPTSSKEFGEKWYISKSTILFGNPKEIKFWWLDVYWVPGSGYVLSDKVSSYRSASEKSCGA
jgi:hypothetical protein